MLERERKKSNLERITCTAKKKMKNCWKIKFSQTSLQKKSNFYRSFFKLKMRWRLRLFKVFTIAFIHLSKSICQIDSSISFTMTRWSLSRLCHDSSNQVSHANTQEFWWSANRSRCYVRQFFLRQFFLRQFFWFSSTIQE